jgi:glycosyltransferase involved in cell wall biosynthesis
MRNKKIVFIITWFTKWWAERQLFNLVSWIKENFNIEVIWFFDWYYKNELENLWINVHLVEINSNIWIFKAIYLVNKIINKINPDIIQSMLSHANIVSKCVNLINFKKYRLFTWVRNSRDSFLLWFLEKITDTFSDKIITNSLTNKKALINRWFNENKIKVIYNWINFINAKETYNYNKKIILTVAKFFSQKDYETNVLVVEKLSKIRSDFKFLYVWDWVELEKIKKLVKGKWLNDFVDFLWIRNDISELMSSCDIFFLPTKFEWQANVLLEAMYYNCNIITTNIPENKEICEAVFWKVWNVDFFSEQIWYFLDNKIDFFSKIYTNKEKIKYFEVSKMVSNYLKVYE